MANQVSQRSGLYTETGASGVWASLPINSATVASSHVVVLPFNTSAVIASNLTCSGTGANKGKIGVCGPLSVLKVRGASVVLCSVGSLENTNSTYKWPKGNYGC